MVTLKTRKSGRNKGLAVVEAALVFPLLLMLTFGAIHYGWLLMRVNQITNAARQGVRVAIRPNATWADVEYAVANVMTNAGISEYNMSTSGIGVPVGDEITVQLTVSTSDPEIGLIKIPLLPTPEELRASVTMAKEGPS